MRPSSYGEEVIAKAEDYLLNYKEKYNDVVPSIEGLCAAVNRARSTLYKWADEEGKEEFSDILNEIKEHQAKALINGGLSGGFNAVITKMMLSKHGYAEEKVSDHTSSDGSMSPDRTKLDDFYADTKS